MKCKWCNKNEIQYELVIYKLRKEATNIANQVGIKLTQTIRDKKYLSIRLCENCLPVTSTTDIDRYKLRGKEIGTKQKTTQLSKE